MLLLLLMVMFRRRLKKSTALRKCGTSTVAKVPKIRWEKAEDKTPQSESSAEPLHCFVKRKVVQLFNGKRRPSQMRKHYWSTNVNWTIGPKEWTKWRVWCWPKLPNALPVVIAERYTKNAMLLYINGFQHTVHKICYCLHACLTTKPGDWHSLVAIFCRVAGWKLTRPSLPTVARASDLPQNLATMGL